MTDEQVNLLKKLGFCYIEGHEERLPELYVVNEQAKLSIVWGELHVVWLFLFDENTGNWSEPAYFEEISFSDILNLSRIIFGLAV